MINYIGIDINPERYSITIVKQKPDSAFATLKKIETILKYGDLNLEELTKLKSNFTEVKQRYYDKVKQLNKVEYFIAYWFRNLQDVNQTVSRIEFLFERELSPSPAAPPLSPDLSFEVARYLTVRDLASLSRVSRASKQLADVIFVERAREFGYEGNEVIGAKKHLQALWKARSLFTPNESIQMERTLRGVKTWTGPQLTDYLSASTQCTTTLACWCLKQFTPLLALRSYWDLAEKKEEVAIPRESTMGELLGFEPIDLLPAPTISEHQKELHRLLTLAVATPDLGLVELLLDLGADPTLLHLSYNTNPFEQALVLRNFVIATKLIERGVDINAPCMRCRFRGLLTPLFYYCSSTPFNNQKVQFLLNNGANPSLPFVNNGRSCYPMQEALFYGASGETIALMEEKLALFQPS